MTFMVICSCTQGICDVNCNIHCDKTYNVKKANQAVMLKHAHISNNENHQVEIRKDGIPLNPEVESEVK